MSKLWKMLRSEEIWPAVSIAVLGYGLLAAFILSMWILGSYMEAKTYSRLTGAQVSTWEAMWVNLRVQDAPLKDGAR